MSLLQVIVIALIIILALGLGLYFMITQEAERKRRIMHVVRGGIPEGDDTEKRQKDMQNKRRAEIARKLKESQDEEQAKSGGLEAKIAQAGFEISVQQYWLFSVLTGILTVALCYLLGLSIYIAAMAGIVGLFGIPRFVLRTAAQRRQKKFLEDFADALEAVVRLLKAGMPVSEAVAMIAKEFTGPVGEEMSRIYDKQKIGVSLHEAAREACWRMPLTEMQIFATGMAIQAQTGASLSEILTNLANLIRSRFRLKRKIKALSSEAIASASIIGALPVLVMLGLYFANREYIMLLFTEPFGNVLLAGCVTWMCIGIFVMKAMINFKI